MRKFISAAALVVFLGGCTPVFTLTPIEQDGETIRYDRGIGMVLSDKPTGSVQVMALGFTDPGLGFGLYPTFEVTALNKGDAPRDFGVENLSLNVEVVGDPPDALELFTKDEYVAEVKGVAAAQQFGMLLGGAAVAYAAQRNAYSTTTGHFGNSSFAVRSYDPAAAEAGIAAAALGTANGIDSVEDSLARAVEKANAEMLQTTTVDPGGAYGGVVVAHNTTGFSYPKNVALSVEWNGETHVFRFKVDKK